MLEAEDFGKGTSSRSTKLIHGGVRYLEQGNISLVMEALKERGLLRQNAPHLVHDLAFIVPNYSWWEAPFYGIGMKVYDLLAGKYGFGRSRILSSQETIEKLPNIQTEGLRGGVVYYDGQFDDTRLLIHMAATAAEHGATLLNYAPVIEITTDGSRLRQMASSSRDDETGHQHTAAGVRVVINAAGIFADHIRQMTDPAARRMMAPSQGIHLVFERSFLRADAAIMVPHTSDGRVLFAIPWHDHTVVGTTDTPIQEPSYEPLPFAEEIEFILDTAAQFLSRPPTRKDILSIYVGIRPLVKAQEDSAEKPLPSLAITPFTSTTLVYSPSSAANGPPTATWPRTASITPPPSPTCPDAALCHARPEAPRLSRIRRRLRRTLGLRIRCSR